MGSGKNRDAKHLKLYNSGSFFDGRAIPEEDYPRIASLVSHFETVIVESHPKLIGENAFASGICLNLNCRLPWGWKQ